MLFPKWQSLRHKLYLIQQPARPYTSIVVVLLVAMASILSSCTTVQYKSPKDVALSTTAVATFSLNKGWTKLWSLPAQPAVSYYRDTLLDKPDIAWSHTAPKTIYVCRVALDYVSPAPPNVLTHFYRSDDLGLHWTTLTLPEPTASCSIQSDPSFADTLVLLDNRGGKFVSRDRGLHWLPIPTPPGWEKATPSELAIQAVAGRIYAGGYWSRDLHTWTAWSPHPAYERGNISFVAVNPRHPDTLYTTLTNCYQRSQQQIGNQNMLCRSDDDGQHWRTILKLALTRDLAAPRFCLASNDPDVLYAWANGSVRSSDEGNTWESLPAVLNGAFGDGPFELCGNMNGSKNASTQVDLAQLNQDTNYHFALTDDGTLYHATQQEETFQGVSFPAGITLWNNSTWKFIAPSPLQGNPPIALNLSILLLTQKAQPSILLAFDKNNLYRYTG